MESLPDLHRQTGGEDQQHDHDLYQHQGEELRAEQYPSLNWKGVHYLVELRVALAPYELAGVENDDRNGEDEEACVRHLQHLERHRINARHHRAVDAGSRDHGEEEAGEHQYEEEDVLRRL